MSILRPGLTLLAAWSLLACRGEIVSAAADVDAGADSQPLPPGDMDAGPASTPETSAPIDAGTPSCTPVDAAPPPPCTTPGFDFGSVGAPVVVGMVPLPAGLAVDGNNLYAASYEIGSVFEVPLDGGAVVTLDAIGQNNVAINTSTVYTVAGGGGGGPQGVVVGCAKTGCGGNYSVVASGQNGVWGVAADDANVYWTNQEQAGGVAMAPVGGGAPTTIANVWANSIVTSAGRVFFLGAAPDGTSGLWTFPATCDGAAPLFSPDGQDAGNGIDVLVADERYVYFGMSDNSGTNDGLIARMPVGGGTLTTLATGQGNFALTMAVDGTNVYWSDNANHTVATVPICGGAVTTLATGVNAASVAVDGSNVYWTDTNSGTISKLAK